MYTCSMSQWLRQRRVCQTGAISLISLMILSFGLFAMSFFFRCESIVSWLRDAVPVFRYVRSDFHVLVGSILLFGLKSECSCRF